MAATPYRWPSTVTGPFEISEHPMLGMLRRRIHQRSAKKENKKTVTSVPISRIWERKTVSETLSKMNYFISFALKKGKGKKREKGKEKETKREKRKEKRINAE
jgi:hypothetical protein